MTYPRPKPPTEYALALGERLRIVRKRQGLTLREVEIRSCRRYKAVVIGSWERGDRAITAEHLVALCAFYGADPREVLAEEPVRPPDLVSQCFTAITAAKNAEIDRLTRSYEAALDGAREEITRLRAEIGERVA